MESALKAFSDLFTEEYNTQRDHWEKALKTELKLEDVSSNLVRKHIDLGAWPILSLEARATHHLAGQTPWKKASQTYIHMNPEGLSESLKDDLNGGARTFFFHKDFFHESAWNSAAKVFRSYEEAKDIEVFLIGQKSMNAPKGFKVRDESQMISARFVHEQGGHNVHELAVLTLEFINKLSTYPTHAFVFLDSHFFKNIAKVRALKLLLQKVAKESGIGKIPKIVTLNSYREWTLYERYSNLLRNNIQVASGLIAGADVIQSSGYQVIFDLDTNERDGEHDERSQRMARNTSHILGLESMLGLVDDAAFGSYHLEELSEQYAEAAWKLMQVLLSFNEIPRREYLDSEIKKVRVERASRLKSRKDILTGINDFPNADEKLGLTLKESNLFRVARDFEELRIKVEGLKDKPKVEILIHGELAGLNNRVSFIKNYFELIGLEVLDPIHNHDKIDNKIIVLCAKDEDYPKLSAKYINEKAVAKYVAGKVNVTGHEAIHTGQNIYQVLSALTQKMIGAQ